MHVILKQYRQKVCAQCSELIKSNNVGCVCKREKIEKKCRIGMCEQLDVYALPSPHGAAK